MRTTLVPECQSELADIWRTGANRCGQLSFLDVSISWLKFGEYMADTCFTFGPRLGLKVRVFKAKLVYFTILVVSTYTIFCRQPNFSTQPSVGKDSI